MEAVARFDRVARIYRAMEYLSFGPMLERCRFAHVPALGAARCALVLGDGDGRFTARLLARHPSLHVDAVDASPVMLRLLRRRVARVGAEARLRTFCCDARAFEPPRRDYDLVVTHFFLDCLNAEDTARLIEGIRPALAPGARWLVSEFQIPSGGAVRARLARMLITSLYAAFRLLTGLQVREIPPWRSLLTQTGFARASTRTLLAGVLVSELWNFHDTTAPGCFPSHPAMARQDEIDAQNLPGIDPGPLPAPEPPEPEPMPAPGPSPEPDPQPYPGPMPTPQPVTRRGHPTLEEFTAGWRA
ncbi:MAG TPA: methyltransferase domain-containing protein [Acidobacteriaceae bacterium]|nr:methyltransferase domain-containing protein [Acidobacteriaceae bacterium]